MPGAADNLILRPYQLDAVEGLRESYRRGCRAVLLQSPTGTGKTVVFTAITRGAQAKGHRALIVVHRRELVRQASDKLTWAGVAHGIIAAGFASDATATVQIAAVQTAVRRLDRLGNFDLLVLDEAHHAVADSWRRLIAAQPGAKLLGVTATPARLDGQGLGIAAGGYFEAIHCGSPIRQLAAEGWLAPVRVFVPKSRIDLDGVRSRGGDYALGDLAERMGRTVVLGDAVDEYAQRARHQPAIAYCCTVAHAEAVAARFRAAGYRAACVHGALAVPERDRLIAGLSNGDIEVLTSCDLISEGLDVPSVAAVILLRPTKSLALFLQQVGRGMRPEPPGKVLAVLDHAGNTLRHGMPDAERAWTLDGVERAEACLGVKDGEIFETRSPRLAPIEIADDLAPLSAERIAWLSALPYRALTGLRLSEAELTVYAAARGYRRGWVWHRLREQRRAAA